jgi:hypothetical protein
MLFSRAIRKYQGYGYARVSGKRHLITSTPKLSAISWLGQRMQFDQFNGREFIAVAARMLVDFAAMH